MKVIDRKPVPIYEVVCFECKSKIHYKASEVSWLHITCPVCGVSLGANTIRPVEYEGAKTTDADVVEVVRCGECKWLTPEGECLEFADAALRLSASDFCSHGEWRGEDE